MALETKLAEAVDDARRAARPGRDLPPDATRPSSKTLDADSTGRPTSRASARRPRGGQRRAAGVLRGARHAARRRCRSPTGRPTCAGTCSSDRGAGAVDDVRRRGLRLQRQDAQRHGADQPRWKRCVRLRPTARSARRSASSTSRDDFPPEAKARADEMVQQPASRRCASDLADARLDGRRDHARRALSRSSTRSTPKIGYPDKWRDYSALADRPRHLRRERACARASSSATRDSRRSASRSTATEWDMTPPTVNAYYNPPLQRDRVPGRRSCSRRSSTRRPTTRSTTAASARSSATR